MDVKKKHHQERKLRKNILPALVVSLVLWSISIFMFLFVDPAIAGAIPGFLILFFLALFFTSSIVLANTRRGLFVAASILLLLLLQYWKVGSAFNTLLVISIFSLFEVYFKANS